MPNQSSDPQSICVLRLSAIGDVCHAVAAVQAIQRRWPDCEVTWVIGQLEAKLLAGMPGVKFVIFDKKAGLKGYLDLRRQLKHQRFDILLHMQLALRASMASLCIRARQKWGFDSARQKEGQAFFVNHQIAPQHEPHVAQGFLGFAKAIGVEAPARLEWQMPIGESALAWQRAQPELAKPYIVIAPAASKAERNWTAEGYAAFADVVERQGFVPVICGGPTELEQNLASEIISRCQCQPHNLVGQTDLKQLLALLKQAEMLLAPDTGPAHMAVTVGTPVIGLYAHSNPKRTGPYGYLDYVVSCYEDVILEQTGKSADALPWGKRAKGDKLMQRLTLAQVLESFERMKKDFKLTTGG